MKAYINISIADDNSFVVKFLPPDLKSKTTTFRAEQYDVMLDTIKEQAKYFQKGVSDGK